MADADPALRRPTVHRGTSAVAVILATLVLIGCSGSTSNSADASSTTTGAGISDAAISAVKAKVPVGCGWRVRADEATSNIAYPDTAATYWATAYTLGDGDRLEMAGSFPDARYASFITYGTDGGAVDTLTDRDLVPTFGGNPFAGDDEAPGRYRAAITTAADPDHPSPSTPGTIHSPPEGSVIYRVYLGRPAGDPTGSAGLPKLTVVSATGVRTPIPTCGRPRASETALDLVNENGPPTDRTPPPTPIFIRPADNGSGLYPNPDNVYVATILGHVPGQVVVVRGTAPTFATGTPGEPITGEEQVRYWSICSNEYRKPYPVSSCLADRDVPLDADGRYTVVVSTPEDRPSNATTAQGVAWLDWGSTSVDSLLLVRHLLASPGFSESATKLAPGALATSSMGAYAPIGSYCTVERFQADGVDACTS